MEYLPLFTKLNDQPCLLVGGGKVAARKLLLLHRAGARVTVVSPVLGQAMTEAQQRGEFEHIATAFQPDNLAGMRLVIAATPQHRTNEAIATAANEKGVFVNVVDDPELCTFIMPSIVDRSPLLVAISSGGNAPVLARKLRERIERMLPAMLGEFVAWAGTLRVHVKAQLEAEQRRGFWENLFDGRATDDFVRGGALVANETARALLADSRSSCGKITLVGAGPGDPDLLTLKALRVLQDSDVIVHDRLVSDGILDLARRDAERINVGKASGHHTLPQDDINELLVRLAREGKAVCRLKGGDPFVFGRGGEELQYIAAAGLPFEVVPGITAMLGCAASAGIPLTHRDYSATLNVVAGHRCSDGALDCNWSQLAAPGQTTVFYMGLANVATICSELIAHGANTELPAAVIEQGTLPGQRVITADLATLPERLQCSGINKAALIIVGEVVSLHDEIGAVLSGCGAHDRLFSARRTIVSQ